MKETNPVFHMLANPVRSALHEAYIALHESEEVERSETLAFEPPDSSLPEPEQRRQLARALSQQIAASVQLQAHTQQLCIFCHSLLGQPEGRPFERLVRVLEVLGKRRKVELEKLLQQMSLLLGPTFVPVLRESVNPTVPSAHPLVLLSEVQNLLTEYKDKQKVVQCSAWQTEAQAADEIARWLYECCQRLQQDTYFLESALSKIRTVFKAEQKARAAY